MRDYEKMWENLKQKLTTEKENDIDFYSWNKCAKILEDMGKLEKEEDSN